MKFIMNYQLLDSYLGARKGSWIAIGHFFHDRGNEHIQKSIDGMYHHVLHDLLNRMPTVFHGMRALFKDRVYDKRSGECNWTTELLKEAFQLIIAKAREQINVLLFLDALDEHNGESERLVQCTEDLQLQSEDAKSLFKLRLCLAARPWPIFKSAFDKCEGLRIHDHTMSDIGRVTYDGLMAASGNN